MIPDDVLTEWDKLDAAIDRIVTALPGQMTSASERLEAERRAFRTLLMKSAMQRSSS